MNKANKESFITELTPKEGNSIKYTWTYKILNWG